MMTKDAEQTAIDRIQSLEIKFHLFKMALMIILSGILLIALHTQTQLAINADAKQQKQTRDYLSCILTIKRTDPNPQSEIDHCIGVFGK